jgi:drug/metabolite transporter (DMT)-like permease
MVPELNNYFVGIMLVLASASGFGLMPIFTKFVYQDGVSTLTVLFLRFFFAAIFFFILLMVTKTEVRLSYRLLFGTLLVGGVFYMVQSILYFNSVHYLTASMVNLLFYAYPAMVTILAIVVNKEPLHRNVVLALMASLIGLVLVLGSGFSGLHKIGVLSALGAALVYAIYILISNLLVKEVSPIVTSTFVAMFASFSLLIAGLATDSISFDFSTTTWFPIMGIVLFSTVLAIYGLFKGLEIIGPTKAAILSTIEPLVTILFGALLFMDHLSPIQWFCAALVILGAVMVTKARGQITK